MALPGLRPFLEKGILSFFSWETLFFLTEKAVIFVFLIKLSIMQVFMIDPPWPKKKGGLRSSRPNQGRALDYTTMSVDDIFSLLDADIFSQATPNHAVFMWTVDQFLADCEKSMADRGYRRHCRFVWDKENGVAPAFTVRYSHEYLIWFYKDRMIPIAETEKGKITTVFREKARQHSRKPDIAYDIVSRLYPFQEKMDVFSRECREGWVSYGDQVDFFS